MAVVAKLLNLVVLLNLQIERIKKLFCKKNQTMKYKNNKIGDKNIKTI